eukprot:m.295418 g.295418  ORF g.295418 m.295418 type:complete len:88 (-) comp16393_c6_seq17:5572-5835(-)
MVISNKWLLSTSATSSMMIVVDDILLGIAGVAVASVGKMGVKSAAKWVFRRGNKILEGTKAEEMVNSWGGDVKITKKAVETVVDTVR